MPPAPSQPLVVRSIYYGGEEHPATRKRVIVVPVARLGLKSNAAIHKFKLLAGPRWSPEPPKDSGIGHTEAGRRHGYIKISCEDFPEPAMNLKWASDTLDTLISTANVSQPAVTSATDLQSKLCAEHERYVCRHTSRYAAFGRESQESQEG